MSAIKDDLIASVQEALAKAGIAATKKDTETHIDAVFAGLLAVTQAKEQVRTPVGTFKWAHVEARDRINPRTGEPVAVEAYSTLKFKVSKAVRVNDADVKPAKKAAKTVAKPAPAKTVATPATVAKKPLVKKPAAKK